MYSITEKEEFITIQFLPEKTIYEKGLDDLRNDIISMYRKTGKMRILIYANLTESKLSPIQLFNNAEKLKESNMAGIKIAVVGSAFNKTPESRFNENVNQNRGIMLNYFEDEQQAIGWLKEGLLNDKE